MDTDAVDYYVTFDSRAVGAAAKYLVEQAGDTKAITCISIQAR